MYDRPMPTDVGGTEKNYRPLGQDPDNLSTIPCCVDHETFQITTATVLPLPPRVLYRLRSNIYTNTQSLSLGFIDRFLHTKLCILFKKFCQVPLTRVRYFTNTIKTILFINPKNRIQNSIV